MSNRPWTCVMCGWQGLTHDATYTEAGAKRCPTCKSGALVLSDPEAEERNAAGTAKRINGERIRKLEKEAPLLLHAGIERPELTNAEQVMARRDEAERRGAVWHQGFLRQRAADEAKGLELRAALVPYLDPEALAALDARRRALPAGYGLSFWGDVTRRHADGRLAAEAEQERAAGARAREIRADFAQIATHEELASHDAWVTERGTAGVNAEIFWRARLGEALGVPSGPKLDVARAERFGRMEPMRSTEAA